MNFHTTTGTILALSAFLFSAALSAQSIRTKITVESASMSKVDHEQPCYLVYPEGDALQPLKDSNANQVIENALQKKGYHLVANPNDAAVFIKIDYAKLEPIEVEAILTQRGSFDYSNAPSTRNYAATMHGGRYQSLGDPSRSRATSAVGFTLSPEGKPIDIGEQKDREAVFVKGKSQTTTLLLHPIVLQVAAWRFDKDDPSITPTEVWKTTSSVENLREEPLENQLSNLAAAAAKQFGKTLKKPKVITLKSNSKSP